MNMVVMKMTHMEHIPEYCDDCIYYGCKPHPYKGWTNGCELCMQCLDDDQEEGWIYDGNERPKNCPLMEVDDLQAESEDKGEISDGYHTFNQLYHQRAVLFATIVNQNKNKSWKSYKHSDGQYCFDSNGEWFIVGIDTPQGTYTYHYSKEYWNMFDCQELECGKEWDGHTEEDVIRLLSLQQEPCEDVLGEIRAKIAAKIGGNGSENDGLDKALAIIDEYIREGKDCTDCILDGTDACPRGAGRAVDAEGCKYFIGESEEKNEEM